MIATKKVFFILFASVLLFPAAAFSQITAPTPIRDTAKRGDTTRKSIFTLQTIGIAPLYVFEMNDNAKIDAPHQFPGARALPDSCYYPGERHLKNIRQLTFEGTNESPSLSHDDRFIAFQAQGVKPNSCDQIYRMPLGTAVPAGRISSGQGRATGAAFLSGNEILFSSTQAVNGGACPAEKQEFDNGSGFYVADSNGKKVRMLANDPHYFNGQASVSQNAASLVFTSTRAGVPELFSMKLDGSDVKRLSRESGLDASYSPNGKEIVFCKPLSKDVSAAEIYVMNRNGSGARQLTHLGAANLSPCWAPDGEHIIFSSNYLDPTHRAFDLFMIKSDGTGLERITYGGGFNGFPLFTRDGKHLVFCSSRNATHPNDVNIFVADWVQ